jgi:hypothetical protein
MKRSTLAVAAVFVVTTIGSLAAHHSPVMFDRTVRKTLVGKVVEFAWMNPHSSIQLDVAAEGGGTERWGVEMGSPNSMVKAGWKSTLLKAGDTVTVAKVSPARASALMSLMLTVSVAVLRAVRE